MKILLTGGGGMVGSNFREHICAQNYTIDAPRSSDLNLLIGDKVNQYVKASKPDLIIHAAGTVGGIQANIASPVRFLGDNLKMGMNVILAAKGAGVPRLLNIGSSCMYPRAAANPLREDSLLTGELEPTNEGYALAKIACARLCQYVTYEQQDMLYKTIIPCNLYGRYDKFEKMNSHMIPSVIRKIAEAIDTDSGSVDIWGSGEARREFMYAGDLADFMHFAIPRFETLPQDLNVGLGYDYSITEYYHAIAAVLGYQGSFVHDMTKPEGMSQKLVDVTGIQKLGWRANTVLESGIDMTYDFYRNRNKR